MFPRYLMTVIPRPVVAGSRAARVGHTDAMGLSWRLRALILAAFVVGASALGGCSTLVEFVTTQSDPAPAGVVYEEDDDLGPVEVYDVSWEATLSPEPTAAAAAVWDMWLRIVTPEVAGAVILDFRVGDSTESDTMAFVVQSDDPALWTLAANLAYADDQDLLLSTLVHEYAHVISLSPGQIDPYASSCDTLSLDEGCALPDSAIDEFDREFWSGFGPDAPDPTNADADVAYEFYLAHEEDFVSDYAATNVVEDFAESFMTFVLEGEPSGDSVVARKLLFFWDRPDYVDIRDHVRAEFGY